MPRRGVAAYARTGQEAVGFSKFAKVSESFGSFQSSKTPETERLDAWTERHNRLTTVLQRWGRASLHHEPCVLADASHASTRRVAAARSARGCNAHVQS